MDAPSSGIIGACSTAPLLLGYSGEALEELSRGTRESFSKPTHGSTNPHLRGTTATDSP
jgi:hypothetical protein